MPRFFAKFPPPNWRHDTRIYIEDVVCPQDDDEAIAAVICKNPGSAKAAGGACAHCGYHGLGNGDPTLREIAKIFGAAINLRCPQGGPLKGDYIQVLNLDYWCESDVDLLKRHLKANPGRDDDPAEDKTFPVIWAAWGGDDTVLNGLKKRFLKSGGQWLYWDYRQMNVTIGRPGVNSPVKHPERRPPKFAIDHKIFVPALAPLLG